MNQLNAVALAQTAMRLQLLKQEQWVACRGDLTGHATGDEFVKVAERKGFLTPYQSSKLLKGDQDGYFLGGYRILYRIAAGSFGRVFRADNPATGEIVAIKVLRRRWTDDQHKVALFEREGKVGMSMSHPNIVRIIAVNRDMGTGLYYLVMEFVEGGNLRELLSVRKKLPVADALRLTEEAATGLTYAFNKGLTHRDIKPTNVLISSTGAAKLVDFGLAEIAGAAEEGDVERTIDYAGLERATGVKQGDPRSDIFFLGCIFYELLAGRPPLEPTRNKVARMSRARYEHVPIIQPEECHLPEAVDDVLSRMMAFEPKERYQSAESTAEALRRARVDVTGMSSGSLTPTGQPTVFLVEGHAALQEKMRDKLKELGFRVLMSADPQRAVDRFSQQPFHALIIDAGTAGQAGLTAFEAIMNEAALARTPCVGVLILSEDQAEWANSLQPRPRVGVLVRPLTIKQLTEKLAELSVKRGSGGGRAPVENP